MTLVQPLHKSIQMFVSLTLKASLTCDQLSHHTKIAKTRSCAHHRAQGLQELVIGLAHFL